MLMLAWVTTTTQWEVEIHGITMDMEELNSKIIKINSWQACNNKTKDSNSNNLEDSNHISKIPIKLQFHNKTMELKTWEEELHQHHLTYSTEEPKMKVCVLSFLITESACRPTHLSWKLSSTKFRWWVIEIIVINEGI